MLKTASILVSTIAFAQASNLAESSSTAADHDKDKASESHKAEVSGHDYDEHDEGEHGSIKAGQWGRSYDSVKAQSFTDEQYARGIDADDDSWAVDYDRWEEEEKEAGEEGASKKEKESKDPVFNKPLGVSDLVNTQKVASNGHYLDAFPALPTIPTNASAAYV